MIAYAATAVVFLVYLVAAWFLGSLLGLQGRDLWILRGGLALIGLIAGLTFLWFYIRNSKRNAAAAAGSRSSSELNQSETDAVLREAEVRLKSSRLGRAANLKNLPIVFVLGDSGTGKTSSMVNSGLEAELLAGQLYEDNSIVPMPTRSANLWYARNMAFIEANGKAIVDTGWWAHLLSRIQPGKVNALKGGHPPRAAVVCVSCETFLKPSGTGALDSTPQAVRHIRTCLEEVARSLGISFPVYVLFTKADRIPFFAEFTRNLSNDEATQVLGVTLPLRPVQDSGVYADQETQRLNATFNNLVLSLADKRPDLLGREHDSQKLGAIYEFPRELRKLRSSVVQSLVDICRPSQLRATPFLRGFYFSGIRAVFVSEVVRPNAPTPAPAPTTGPLADATGIFQSGGGVLNTTIPQPKVVGTRKVPQWTFLTHFFTDVLLQDRMAMATTGASVKTNSLRRVLLATGSVLCLLFSIAFITSYIGNRSLEREVAEAAQGIAAAGPVSVSAGPTAGTLAKLETLRQSVEKLSAYKRDGAPWRLRWGLYVGSDLYTPARNLYFKRFDELLFGATQASLLSFLKGVPATPGPGDEYDVAYSSLKAYLITTSNHDKSSQMFLAPVLQARWAAGRNADADVLALTQKQFDFYSEELKAENPYSSENDTLAVARARRYLSQFAGVERVYQSMLAEASLKSPNLNFNRKYPGSAETVTDNRDISGAYSKAGWTFMQDAIKNVDRFFSGEQWVLGEQGSVGIDRANLEQQLKDRYTADFTSQWQQFLRAAAVVRYTSIKDAAAKLNKLSSNQSPLLQLFCMVSQNTNVENPQIKASFQSVQFLTPPTPCDTQLIGESNAGYMQALLGLGALLEQIANAPGASNPELMAQATASALQAKILTGQLAQKFQIEQNQLQSFVQALLVAPITYVELLIRNMGPTELNAKGRGFCSEFSALTAKYPFNSSATARHATLQDLNSVFQPPQGAFWTFYETNLRNLIVRQGTQYVAKEGSPIPLNPAFLAFWNRAAAFAEAVYPDNSPQPRLAYTLKPVRVEGVESSLSIDGQTATTSGPGAPRQFVWNGNPNGEAKLTGSLGQSAGLDFLTYQGLWAPFQLFADADKTTATPAGYSLEWVPRQGRGSNPMRLPNGMPLTIRFDLEGKTAALFQKSFLAGLSCNPEIAR